MEALKNKISLALILAITLIVGTASANHAGDSNDTPNRPGIHFIENMEGLSYPSFNNFENNPNIMSSDPVNDPHPTHGDEREFLIGRRCLNYDCSTSNQRYFNEEQDVLSEGDTVRFAIYYHNNAEDPFNGDSGAPHAENVEVGIDLKNIVDPSNDFILRPKGYIYAPNNEYRTTSNSYNTNGSNQIIDEAGGIVRTATDDMRLLLDDSNLELKPLEGRTYLATLLNDDPEEKFVGQINGATNLTWDTEVADFTTQVNTHYDAESEKLWISLNEVPGCFRYSGWAYFDAVVVEKPPEPNVCEDLTLDTDREIPEEEADEITLGVHTGPMHELTLNELDFENETLPSGTTLIWTAEDDPDGVFWIPFLFGSHIPVPNTVELGAILPASSNSVIYEGIGKVSVEVNTQDPDLDSRSCEDDTFFEEEEIEEQVCEELLVNFQDPIYEQRLSTFNAKSIEEDTDGDGVQEVFKGKITYSVTDEKHGKFYILKPPLAENSSPTTTEFDASEVIEVPDNGWCGPDDEENDIWTGFPGIDLGVDSRVAISADDLDLDFSNVVGATQFDLTKSLDTSSTANIPDIPGAALPDFPTYEIIDIGSTVAFDQDNLFTKYNAEDFYKVPDWVNSGMAISSPTATFEPMSADLSASIFNILTAHAAPNPGSFEFEIDPSFTANYDPLADIIAQPFALDIALEPDFDVWLYDTYTSVTVDPGTEVYFWGDEPGEDVIVVSTACTEEEDCTRYFDVTPLDRWCTDITVECDPADPFVGNDVSCEITVTEDNEGDVLPDETKILWTTDTECTFSDPNNVGGDITHLNTLIDQPVTCTAPQVAGDIFVTIDESDELYGTACNFTLPVEGDQFCEDLTLFVRYFGDENLQVNLEARKIYSVSADTDYSFDNSNTVDLNVDSGVGRFITDLTLAQLAEITDPLNEEEFTIDYLESVFDTTQLHTELTVDELELVTLITFSSPTDLAEAVTAQASDFPDETACFEWIGVELEEELECESVNIVEENDCFSITGDFENHDGEITACVTEGEIATDGSSEFGPCATYTAEEVAASGNSLSFECNDTEDANILVEAIGSDNPECIDSVENEEICIDLDITTPDSPWELDSDDDEQLFEIDVETSPASLAEELTIRWETSEGHWDRDGNPDEFEDEDVFLATLEFDEGDEPTVTISALDEDGEPITACSDSINSDLEEDDDNPPEIEKFVYPENAFNDADDDIINIAEPAVTPYVTYMLVVNIGNDIKNINITDEYITASGKILSSGSLSGFLNFEELAVFVIDGNDEQPVYLSSGYHEDALSPSGPYSEFHDDNLNIDDDDNLDDQFDCNEVNDEEDFCLDDYDDAEENFGKGSKLRFKNVDQLDDDSKIIIKYEMANVSVINQVTCQDLPSDSGCGEAFLNVGRYDSEDTEYDDADDAEVIVVCPYILTREGGDVFFHDVIDTGAEAAYCSEFKGGDGPGIIPVPVPKQTTPSTGQGDLPEGTLSLDTHDICKYSNLDTNIEGYDNVLSNFSSTICELQATVAEEWTEQYINDAIKANITRVARWGQTFRNSATQNLSGVSDISSENPGSGIFVSINNDININGIGGNYEVGAFGDIPAGQTYIVQNADLNINSNITYADSAFDNPDNIPSAAFIVIDGNINIGANVTELHGVFMAINTDPTADLGQVISAAGTDGQKKTKNQLTIYGNLIGNVVDLFTNRIHVGNASQDEGSVVIHYDERILLNTPPGISELVSVEYALVPN
jgi:hypothetical protein